MSVVMVSLAVAGCETDPVRPGPQSVELRVIGTGGRYVAGTVSFGLTVVDLQPGSADLRASIDADPPRVETLVLDLHKAAPLREGGQTTVSFDRYTASVTLTPGIVVVDLGLLDAASPMLELARPELAATLHDDPCTLETRVESDFARVDADRALYAGSFTNLLAFAFASSDAYGGGDLFEDSARAHFDSTCATESWDLADTLVCVETSSSIACVGHAWERTG